jgi:hypothetical protein
VAWHHLGGEDVSYEHSDIESERFGRSVGRLTVGFGVSRPDHAVAATHECLSSVDADIVIVRFPAHMAAVAGGLTTSGWTLVPAGSLTYWEAPAVDLAQTTQSRAGDSRGEDVHGGRRVWRGNDDEAPAFTSGVAELVTSVVEDSFAGYANHYSANPLLSEDDALAGYVDWAVRTVVADRASVLILWNDQRPVGLATVESSPDGTDLEVLLAGLVRHAQGHGWYAELIAAVGREALARHHERVIISTQAHNVKVQRSWARAGFLPFSAVETVHAVRPGLLG